LLSLMMYDASLVVEVRKQIGVDTFYIPAHQKIADAIFEAARRGEDGLLPVKDVLAERGQLNAIGHGTGERDGKDYLIHLFTDFGFDAANFDYHVKMVKNASVLRNLAKLGHTISNEAMQASISDVDTLLSTYQDTLFQMDTQADQGGGLVELGTAVDAAAAHADAVKAGTASPGLPTGFTAIDRPTGGMQPGDVWVVAAGTSVGKTAFALGVASHIASEGGAVLHVSLEMDRRSVANRLLSGTANIPGLSLRTGEITDEQFNARKEAIILMRSWNLAIEDGAVSVSEIGVRARQLASRWRRPLDLIVVDYAQLLRPVKGKSRAEEVSTVLWDLKSLSMSTGIPILCLSQLNREGVKAGMPPSLHALKESGDIENTASVVLLLHRPFPTQFDTSGATIIWARVAKARDGCITAWPVDEYSDGIKLRFRNEYARFEPLTL